MLNENQMEYLKQYFLELAHNTSEDPETVVERARVYVKFVTEKEAV